MITPAYLITDRVVIVNPDSIHNGKHGEIVEVYTDRDKPYYLVRIDYEGPGIANVFAFDEDLAGEHNTHCR